MKKRDLKKELALLISAGALAAACSPMEQSVSKLSNASVEPVKANQSTSPNSLNGSGTQGVFVTNSVRAATGASGALLITQLQTYADYHSKASQLAQRMRTGFELDQTALDELKNHGVADFSSDADKVKGQEDGLAATTTRISFVLNADAGTIANMGLGDLKAKIAWSDPTVTPTGQIPGQWKLSVVAPSTDDPVKDMNELNRILKALQDNLVAVSVEFQAAAD